MSEKGGLPQRRAHQLDVGFQRISPEDRQRRNTVQTGQVTFRNAYVCNKKLVKVEAINLKESGPGIGEGFWGGKGRKKYNYIIVRKINYLWVWGDGLVSNMPVMQE